MNARRIRDVAASLLSRPASSPQPTVYARDDGFVCVEARVIYQPETRPAFARELLATPFDWYGVSERRPEVPVAADAPVRGLPATRPLAALTVETTALLADDLEERNVDVALDDAPRRPYERLPAPLKLESRPVLAEAGEGG